MLPELYFIGVQAIVGKLSLAVELAIYIYICMFSTELAITGSNAGREYFAASSWQDAVHSPDSKVLSLAPGVVETPGHFHNRHEFLPVYCRNHS